MSVSLGKGQKVSLSKEAGGNLKVVQVAAGWDVNNYDTGHDFDLDIFTFMCNDDKRTTSDDDFVYYKNQKHTSGSVALITGDSTTGSGDGDDEIVQVEFDKLPSDVTHIMFAITIYDAETRGQNFGQVENSYIRVTDVDTGKELCRYDLGEDFSTETAVVFGELYKNNEEWKFNAIGSGYQGGLISLCHQYGIEAER